MSILARSSVSGDKKTIEQRIKASATSTTPNRKFAETVVRSRRLRADVSAPPLDRSDTNHSDSEPPTSLRGINCWCSCCSNTYPNRPDQNRQ